MIPYASACDPYGPDARFDELGVARADLDTVLRESDVVSLHVVLNRETRHMIGAEQFGLMKPAAIFINTARGFCVDESAFDLGYCGERPRPGYQLDHGVRSPRPAR